MVHVTRETAREKHIKQSNSVGVNFNITYVYVQRCTCSASPGRHTFSQRHAFRANYLPQSLCLDNVKRNVTTGCKSDLLKPVKASWNGCECWSETGQCAGEWLLLAHLKAMLLRWHPHQPLRRPVGLAGGGERRVGGGRTGSDPGVQEAGDIVGSAPCGLGHGSAGRHNPTLDARLSRDFPITGLCVLRGGSDVERCRWQREMTDRKTDSVPGARTWRKNNVSMQVA